MSTSGEKLKTPSLPSVPRALEVLEHIAASPNGLKLSQITRLLGYPRSTVHCLLLTLERAGYIARSTPRGPYVCGSRLLELSGKALAGSSLREIAMPTLRQLMQRTRLPVHVALLEREQVTIIAQIAPPGTRLLTSPGQRLEVHCTALGKAIAAYLPEARLTEILRARALTPHNERTIISPKKFADELALSKQRGYAVDDEEDAIGYRCLAAPILDAGGAPVAAVSVMGTTMQISADNAASLGVELTKAADRIAECLRADTESSAAAGMTA
jgi:DNA-binding IclR family transcriptional regulator